MKVLHYVSSFSPLSQTFIYDYITELEEQGVENWVATFKRENIEDRPFDKVIQLQMPGRWNLEKIIRRFYAVITNKPKMTHLWAQMRRELEKVVLDVEPDIIHAHFGPKGVEAATVANKLGKPFIVSFHGFDIFQIAQDPFWVNQYENILESNCLVTCVSEYMKKHLLNIFPDSKLKVIHVGKRIENYSYNTPAKKIMQWLSIGRLAEKKGHEDTIRAFAEIINIFPNQKLRIIGGGERKKKLQQLIKDLDISDYVTLVGSIPHHEVKNELAEADAFILTSKTAKSGNKEGIPTVLMEAQAVGLPCVSTLHSGIPEAFPERNQKFLAEEANVEQIAYKIRALIESNKEEIERISIRGRKKIEKDFNLVTEVKKIKKVYQTLI